MSEYLEVRLFKKGYYKMYYHNVTFIGDLICGDDGYYAWYPDSTKEGYIPEHLILAIYKELKKLNEDWDKQVREFHDK